MEYRRFAHEKQREKEKKDDHDMTVKAEEKQSQ